jgi:hypothetical protein
MHNVFVQTIGVFKMIVFVNTASRQGSNLTRAPGQFDHAFVADLELALISVGDQKAVAEGAAGLQAKLGTREDGAKQAGRITLRQAWIAAHLGEGDAKQSFRGDVLRQGKGNFRPVLFQQIINRGNLIACRSWPACGLLALHRAGAIAAHHGTGHKNSLVVGPFGLAQPIWIWAAMGYLLQHCDILVCTTLIWTGCGLL